MSPYFEPEDFLSQSSQGDCVTLSQYTHCAVPHPLCLVLLFDSVLIKLHHIGRCCLVAFNRSFIYISLKSQVMTFFGGG